MKQVSNPSSLQHFILLLLSALVFLFTLIFDWTEFSAASLESAFLFTLIFTWTEFREAGLKFVLPLTLSLLLLLSVFLFTLIFTWTEFREAGLESVVPPTLLELSPCPLVVTLDQLWVLLALNCNHILVFISFRICNIVCITVFNINISIKIFGMFGTMPDLPTPPPLPPPEFFEKMEGCWESE